MMNDDLQYEPTSLSSEGWKPQSFRNTFTQSLNFEVRGAQSEVEWRSSHEKYLAICPWPDSGFMQSLHYSILILFMENNSW